MLTSRERNLVVASRISLILGVLSLILLIILISAFGVNINTPLIGGICAFFLLIAYFTSRGTFDAGRILISIVPPILTLFAAIQAKTEGPTFTDILYYDSRFFLILFGIVPCLIFDTREKVSLYGCLAVILITLIVFDPLHEYFDVGYFQRGFSSSSYYYINYVAVLVFVGIAAGAISLKLVIENAERQSERYKGELLSTNTRLSEALNDVEAQNEEIKAQSEELLASQDQLVAANAVIAKQKAELQKQVKQINADLHEANEELVKHNNELQQFSYSISHHLRGPIARLLGLTNLVKITGKLQEDEETSIVLNHIETSAVELDVVIRDLSSIVDIRNSLYQLRQPIDFGKEWNEIKKLLNITDEWEERQFEVDFSAAPTIYSVRPMIHSIMFNLISNAIKFRSDERELRVKLRTVVDGPSTIFEISDNGLGIDLGLFQGEMFKMYKRFHPHQEGRGLGLYLIKSQTELLNGFVDVTSKPDQGTTFRVHIKTRSATESGLIEQISQNGKTLR